MAGDWIPMRLDLAEDPAVLEMAEMLGETEEYIVGSLHKIWSWASRQCHDGTVTGVTVSSLSRAVKLPTVVAAMLNVGWLIEGTNDAGRPFIAFPKWENWLSKSAKSRLRNTKNQQNLRDGKEKEKPGKADSKPKTVTKVSPPKGDESVTTGEESTGDSKNPLDPPKGETGESAEKPEQPEDPPPQKPKRTPKETVGEFEVPPRLDTPEIRQALADFETMRARTGKRIKDRGNVCRGWDKRFVDADHLLACIEFTISNEYQGISPDYITANQSAAAVKPSIWDRVKKY